MSRKFGSMLLMEENSSAEQALKNMGDMYSVTMH